MICCWGSFGIYLKVSFYQTWLFKICTVRKKNELDYPSEFDFNYLVLLLLSKNILQK